ncbi:hypothetical protein B0H11DRAFT_2302582 [Mycena galericulata]|nr:hypothetical protein B0H11DRAFT_2302582 [Mycena galericulata]
MRKLCLNQDLTACQWDTAVGHRLPLRLLRTRNVPILQSVVLDIRDAGTTLPSYPSRLGFLPFLEASNIRYVSIKTYPTNFYRYPLNWEELRNLSLGPRVRGQQPHTVSFLETHHILRRCVQLRTFIIPLYDSDVGGVPPTAPLRLENLRRLCVIDSLNNTVIFKRVDLPNLRHLEYKSISVRLMFMSSLHAPEQITSLSLSTPLSQSSLRECLRYLPRLQNLTINWFQAIGGRLQLFPLLTPRPDDPHSVLCPDLQHICCLRLEDGSDQELLEMIMARADANAALSSVDIAREREVDIVPQLQPLIDERHEGLRVSLRYPTSANIKLGFDQFLWSYDERRWVDPGMSEWHPISEDWKADYARWGLPSQDSPQESISIYLFTKK